MFKAMVVHDAELIPKLMKKQGMTFTFILPHLKLS